MKSQKSRAGLFPRSVHKFNAYLLLPTGIIALAVLAVSLVLESTGHNVPEELLGISLYYGLFGIAGGWYSAACLQTLNRVARERNSTED